MSNQLPSPPVTNGSSESGLGGGNQRVFLKRRLSPPSPTPPPTPAGPAGQHPNNNAYVTKKRMTNGTARFPTPSSVPQNGDKQQQQQRGGQPMKRRKMLTKVDHINKGVERRNGDSGVAAAARHQHNSSSDSSRQKNQLVRRSTPPPLTLAPGLDPHQHHPVPGRVF